jgi:NADPH-dependent glutamate synthase beta subunit-like oxidoreductase/Pyruvate/2-oxoacid:ferredoxin oxidoreductase delta subunit
VSPLDHVDDYPEIPVSLAPTTTALKTGAWRSVRPVLSERTAPCAAACPAGVDVPRYLHLITLGRIEEAFALFTERNPFPRITGRVCPHTCQDTCNLAVTTEDGAVSIRSIERWLGDATAHLPHVGPTARSGRRVAVVGSGPAGLSAAFHLRRRGHEVTVYERRAEIGGMLRHAIPEYRLPGEVVDAEVERLRAMGIEFRPGTALGEGVTLDDLEDEFAAVFVATGAGVERPLGIPGEHLVHGGLDLLEAVSRGERPRPGRRCAVVGAGNTAMDVARVLRRLGAEVTVLYRRTIEEMPAIAEEYERAVDDGVRFEWLALPRAVTQAADGLVVEVERMRLGAPDASGRRRPEATGVTRPRTFDAVFSAVGEVADVAPLPDRLLGPDGWIGVRADGATADPAVLAGGDLVTGPATVVAAIAAGRTAALAIDRMLGGTGPGEIDPAVVTPDAVNPIRRVRHTPATEAPSGALDPMAEETVTLAAEAILAEIERCLSCGHCNECGTCFAFCPDGAIAWENGPIIDLEYCKGCGICVTECPGRTLVLVNERELEHA